MVISWIRIKSILIAEWIVFVKNRYKTVEILDWPSKNIHFTIIKNPGREARGNNKKWPTSSFSTCTRLSAGSVWQGDEELTKKLWQDVADRDIDLHRVINLMYTCSCYEDDYEMTKVDETYQKTGLIGWINYHSTARYYLNQ